MTSGLINLVSYGTQDLYLVGSPEITHFKVVYRRYTNFAVESKEIRFDNNVNFGLECTSLLPRIGDLIGRIYLQMTTPTISFIRPLDQTVIDTAYSAYLATLTDLNTIADFMSLNLEAYRGALDEYTAENDQAYDNMRDRILEVFGLVSTGNINYDLNLTIVNNFITLLTNEVDSNGNALYNITDINLNYIAESANPFITKSDFLSLLNKAIKVSNSVQKHFTTKSNTALQAYQEVSSPRYKFAWVDRLGHALIDYVEIYIGGDKLDKQYGDWINIFWELAGNQQHYTNYMNMIGHTEGMRAFDRTEKKAYTMMVPLQFWFNRFNGMALPYVALEHADITIAVKFRKFQDVSYIEQSSDFSSNFTLNDLAADTGYRLDAKLLVDYVYLDALERRKFAQSSHEYLIEQMQTVTFKNIYLSNVSEKLDFVHPSKEITWVAQNENKLVNDYGFTKIDWFDYAIGGKNPIYDTELWFSGYERVKRKQSGYYNYLQPYYRHRNIPPEGINTYSFALEPDESQPSGHCNLSRITNININMTLNDAIFTAANTTDTQTVQLRVYCRNFNILRIASGFGREAFAY